MENLFYSLLISLSGFACSNYSGNNKNYSVKKIKVDGSDMYEVQFDNSERRLARKIIRKNYLSLPEIDNKKFKLTKEQLFNFYHYTKNIGEVKIDKYSEKIAKKNLKDIQKHYDNINNAIENSYVDELQKLARQGSGFINSELRKKAWSLILGCDDEKNYEDNEIRNKDRVQIKKDYTRTMGCTFFDVLKGGKNNKKLLIARQDGLRDILHKVFSINKDLGYSQGFDHIVIVLYIVCGYEKQLTTKMASSLANNYLKDVLLNNLLKDVLNNLGSISKLFPKLLEFANRGLHSKMPYHHFLISIYFTWSSRYFYKFDYVARLFDFFLCSHPLIPIYFSVALLITMDEEGMFDLEIEEGKYGNEDIYHLLRRHKNEELEDVKCSLEKLLDKNGIEYLNKIIEKADKLFEGYPPEKLLEGSPINKLKPEQSSYKREVRTSCFGCCILPYF